MHHSKPAICFSSPCLWGEHELGAGENNPPPNCYNIKLLMNMQEVSGTTPAFSQLSSEGRNNLLQ